MTAEEISNRQNSEKMLSIQYAARKYFNIAELQNYIIWTLIIIASIVGLPFNWHSSVQSAITISTAIAIYIFEKEKDKNINSGADLREYFDHYLFGLPYEKKNEVYLFELADTIIQRYPEEYRVQAANTGKDTPPGVRNWYDSVYIDNCKTNPIFHCQCENKWWDKIMSKFGRGICYAMLFGLISIFVILYRNKSICDILAVAAAFIEIGIILAVKILNWRKYDNQSIRIESIIENYDNYADEKGAIILQHAIDERRHLPIVHFNFIHSKLSSQLHDRYARINRMR